MTRPGDRPPSARTAPSAPRRRLSANEESLMLGHELRDMRLRTVVGWLALLVVAIAGIVILAAVLQRGVVGHLGQLDPVVGVVPQVTPPPAPRLEQENGATLATLRAQEDKILNNYTWIDEAAGKVSLPIDRAIELTVQRGLPVQQPPNAQANPGVTLPQSSSSGRTSETIP